MTERPHLVDDSQWIRSHNIKTVNSYVEQVPHKVNFVIPAMPNENVLALIAVPTEVRGECFVIGLTDTRAVSLTPVVGTPAVTAALMYSNEQAV